MLSDEVIEVVQFETHLYNKLYNDIYEHDILVGSFCQCSNSVIAKFYMLDMYLISYVLLKSIWG